MEEKINSLKNEDLIKIKKKLGENNFDVFTAETKEEAQSIFKAEILEKIEVKSLSWGGSLTVNETGILEIMKNLKNINFIDTNEPEIAWEILLERRRAALLTDLFVTGVNAITENGYLVNLDAVGNRISGLVFGPKNVTVIAGINKIVPDLDSAFRRIKDYTAPANSKRLNFEIKTPCIYTGKCANCRSSQRICNVWSITERSWPAGRIKIILINKSFGL